MEASGNNSIRVLLVGNNPIEMSKIYDVLKSSLRPVFETEASFDMNDTFKRFEKFKPTSLLIDEDLGKENIQKLIESLKSSNLYDQIGITLIKASYCKEILLNGIQEYVLKAELTKEKLANSILNSVRFKKAEISLKKSYGKKMENLKNLFNKNTLVKSSSQWKPTWM
jgi:hypothetical protein